MEGRIWFAENPWPGGHAVTEVEWRGRIDADGALWFDLRLRTADYDADPPTNPGAGDWGSPEVWRNHRRCTLGSSRVDCLRADPFRLSAPQTLTADPPASRDPLSPAFTVHLLGRDACADHTLTFVPTATGHSLTWTGALALAHAGDEVLRHRFRAELHELALPRIALPPDTPTGSAPQWLARVIDTPSRYVLADREFVPTS